MKLLANSIICGVLKGVVNSEITKESSFNTITKVIVTAPRTYLESQHWKPTEPVVALMKQSAKKPKLKVCFNCNEPGHFVRDCKKPLKSKPVEQESTLLLRSLTTSVKLSKTEWLIDSGASYHFCPDPSMMVNLKKVPSIYVQCAFGTSTLRVSWKVKKNPRDEN